MNGIEATRIEKTAERLVGPGLVKMIIEQDALLVTGQPLCVFDGENQSNDKFLEECEPLQDELLIAPFVLFTQRIPWAGHSNHPDVFLSDEGFPALRGYTVSGSEIVMGIREALGFSIKSASEVDIR